MTRDWKLGEWRVSFRVQRKAGELNNRFQVCLRVLIENHVREEPSSLQWMLSYGCASKAHMLMRIYFDNNFYFYHLQYKC